MPLIYFHCAFIDFYIMCDYNHCSIVYPIYSMFKLSISNFEHPSLTFFTTTTRALGTFSIDCRLKKMPFVCTVLTK